MTLLRLLWELYDRAFVFAARLRRVGRGPEALLVVRIVRHAGGPLTLPDGTRILPGTPVGELHYLSSHLRALHAHHRPEAAVGMAVLHSTLTSLEQLALFVVTQPAYRDLPAFYADTLFHRGAERLGFQIVELPPSCRKSFLRHYLRWLLAVYHPQGFRRLRRHADALEPKTLWMSRRELLDRYLSPKVRPLKRRVP
ncbi:MAG: hypothetical protein M0031_06780 [Thermaerobacter sp.]|jgi:hypothetical protein|nr:hypothetical protein [Thermaerobacter sp.]